MRYRAWADCTVSTRETSVSTASTTCSIGGFTPNPLRADREVDDETGDDADRVGEQVIEAEPGEQLNHADVDRHGGESGQAEGGETLRGQPHPAERPYLVGQEVVHDR